MATRLDDVMTLLGTGKWNLLHFISLSYCFSLTTYHTLGGAFLAPRVEYTCRTHSQIPTLNFTSSGNGSDVRKQCSYLALDPDSGEVEEEPCTDWDFENSTFVSTVATELVCGWEYLRSTYQSIYMFGVTIGAPFNGLLADRFGRKMTVGVGSILYTILAIGSSWLPNLSALLCSRFLMGVIHPTIQKTGYVLALEAADPKWRMHIGIVLFLPWALGLMAWGVFAYLIREWRMLQLTVSLLCLVFLPTLWFMDESPRWLAVRGQHQRALKILKKAASWNKVELPPDDELLLLLRNAVKHETNEHPEDYQENKSKVPLKRRLQDAFILFRTPRIRLITLSLYCNYLLVGIVYFGLSLSGGDLSDDPFLFMVLTGVVELPAYTLVIPVVARFGRRAPVVAFFFLSGVALLALPFVPSGTSESMTLGLLGKMAIASAFQILDFYASELFPTEVRTRGISTALVMSRVGSTCSPFITDYLGPLYPWAPSAVFGAASVVGGLATLALPETLNVALPDTIAHLEKRQIKTSGCLRLPVKEPDPVLSLGTDAE